MRKMRKGVIRIGKYRVGIIFLLLLAVAGVLASPQSASMLSMMGVTEESVQHGDWLIGTARCMNMEAPIRSPEDIDGWFDLDGDSKTFTPKNIQMGTVGGWTVRIRNPTPWYIIGGGAKTKIEICEYNPITKAIGDCRSPIVIDQHSELPVNLNHREAVKVTNPTTIGSKDAKYQIEASQYGMYAYRPMIGFGLVQSGCDVLAGEFHQEYYLKAITEATNPNAVFLNVEEKRMAFEKTEEYSTSTRMYPGQYFNYPDTLIPTFVDPYTYNSREVTCKEALGGGKMLYGFVDLKTVGNVLYRVPDLNNEVAPVECCPGDSQPITGKACSEATFKWIAEEEVECSLTRPCPSSLSRPHDETTLKKVTCDIGGTNKCTNVEYINVECTTSAVCSPGQVCANNKCVYTGTGALRPPDIRGDDDDGDVSFLDELVNRFVHWLSDKLGISWKQAYYLAVVIALLILLIVMAPALKALMGAGAVSRSAAPSITVTTA